MQKRSRARLEENFVAFAPDVEPVERADGRVRLALGIAKGGKIVLARERLRSNGFTRQAEPRSTVRGARRLTMR
jgi:hypothetical protein